MNYLDFIDTRVGTDNSYNYSNGNALAYTGVPFGMNYGCVQSFSDRGSWWFNPNHPTFQGFRITHQPSPWMGDFSHFLISPFSGEVMDYSLGTLQSSYRSNEAIFKPHMNQIFSYRYRQTSTFSASTYGFKIKSKSPKNISFKISASEGLSGTINTQDKTLELEVKNYSGCEDSNFTMFVCIDINEFEIIDLEDAFIINTNRTEMVLEGATSFISHAQAKLNLQRDKSSFDDYINANQNAWLKYLNRIEIENKNLDQFKMFYTAMYRSFLFPMTFYELDASNHEIHYNTLSKSVCSGKLYTNNGFWDTGKTVYPLFSMIAQDEYASFLEGYLNSYKESGYLPKWLSPDERGLMPGTLIDSVIGDACAKDIALDLMPELYEAMYKSAHTQSDNPNYGRHGTEVYKELGYIPSENHESVNQTLDNAFSDYCISIVAKHLGKSEDAAYFDTSALNYKNLFNPEHNLMQTKHKNGTFTNSFSDIEWGHGYTEGSAWQNSFAVYHDVQGLINLYPSNHQFLKTLTKLVNQRPFFEVGSYGFEIHEMSEVAAIDFGQMGISNQPSFHLPYLFVYAKKPESTQVLVRSLVRETFKPTFNGYPGDEDNGSMSAWYIFSSLGFYPVAPGSGEYVLGAPSIDSAKLHLSNGNTLTLSNHENYDFKNFVYETRVNDTPYTKLYLKHSDIMSGMHLETTMGIVSNDIEYSNEDLPFSSSK